MTIISMGAAISSGPRLIAQQPLIVLAWGLAYVLIAVVPQFLMIGAFLPDLANFYREAIQSAGSGQAPVASPEMLKIQAEIARYQPLQILTGMVGAAIVNSAVYRAVLEPENKAYAYLRLGAQELWVGLTNIVFYIVVVLAAIVAMVPLAILAGFSGVTGASSWTNGLLAFLMACGAAAVVIWIALRLSLALPMSFAQRNFRLFESWDLTREQGWRLFGVAAGVFGIILVGELVIMGLAGALGAGKALAILNGLKAFATHPPANWLVIAAPWIAIGLAVYTVLMGVALTILTVPFATIYKELSPPAIGDTF